MESHDSNTSPVNDTYCNIYYSNDHVHIDTDYRWFKVIWDGNDGYTGTEINNTDFDIMVATYAATTYGQNFPVITVYDKNNNTIASIGSYGSGEWGGDYYKIALVTSAEGIVMYVPSEIEKFDSHKVTTFVRNFNSNPYYVSISAFTNLFDCDNVPEGYCFVSYFNVISCNFFPCEVSFEGVDINTYCILVNDATEEATCIEPNDDGTFTLPFSGLIALIYPDPDL